MKPISYCLAAIASMVTGCGAADMNPEEPLDAQQRVSSIILCNSLSRLPDDGCGDPPPPPPPPPPPTYYIGVIPNTTCPSGSDTVVIWMDNENDDAGTVHSAWVGNTSLDENRDTTFRFCRVDGTNWRPLSTSNSNDYNYAVLRLGSACPPGSVEVVRYFDNEDSSPDNYYSGPIGPNLVDGNTTMKFCLFAGGSSTMAALPDLGFSYGVFANTVFRPALDTGYIWTDDEDHNTQNWYSVSSSYAEAAQQIIVPMAPSGQNTLLRTVRVK